MDALRYTVFEELGRDAQRGIQIGRIYGIPIFLHPSWFFIFGLIALSFVSKYERSTSVFLNRGCGAWDW